MVISGSTIVMVNGRSTRVLGHRFNKVLRKDPSAIFTDNEGNAITPSKGLSWIDVAKKVRAGTKVQAATKK